MNQETATTPIRDLMPDGFTRIIAQESGAHRSTVSTVVSDERVDSKVWPFVEKLAKQTNPAEYEKRMAFIKYRSHFSNAA